MKTNRTESSQAVVDRVRADAYFQSYHSVTAKYFRRGHSTYAAQVRNKTLQCWLLTPELQRQARGTQRADLRGIGVPVHLP